MDYDTIDQQLLPSFAALLAAWLPAGRMDGHEYKIGGLDGKPGGSMSVNVHTGVWKDFASGDGGPGPLSLYAAINGISKPEAARRLSDAPRHATHAPRHATPPQKWAPLPHVPDNAPPPNFTHWKHGAPSRTWTYRTATGAVIGHVCRFDMQDGSKEVLPLTWARSPDGAEAWKWLSFAKPRPLYGLKLLADKPDVGVVIVEGEKTADAANDIAPGVSITWPGGSKAVKFVDWEPLRDRRVVIWPDRDKAGMDAANDIHHALKGIAATCRIITPPDGDQDGWDLADALADGWTLERVSAWIRKDKERADTSDPADTSDATDTASEPTQNAPREPIDIEEPMPTADYDPADDIQEPSASMAKKFQSSNEPFRILGHANGEYFYHAKSTLEVVTLTASAHTKQNLFRLAPINHWEMDYPGGKSANWDAAVNSLMNRAHEKRFLSASIRGRGAWIDAGRIVYHAGDKIFTDGKQVKLEEFDTKFTYPARDAINVDFSLEPASNYDASLLTELCNSWRWRNHMDHKFLAGWIMLAPICGALSWRPHVWLTGPSGTGKTWLIDEVVYNILGESALYSNTDTTEPGIRQALQSDGLTVVFDEAESENERDAQRVAKVLRLARQASREGASRVLKGTATGDGMSFQARSCFMFASIGVAATERADTSRITTLEILPRNPASPEYATAWDKMLAIWTRTAGNKDWCQAMRSRAVSLAPVIADNSRTFAKACLGHLGQQRDADQIGALLAGAYACVSRNRISLEAALDWCATQDWTEVRDKDADTDEVRCLRHLLESIIRIDYVINEHGDTRSSNKPISTLIQDAATGEPKTASLAGIKNENGAQSVAEQAFVNLRNHGILVQNDVIYISNSHQMLAKIFENTPWNGGKWKHQFSRVAGAVSSKQRFSGTPSNCIRLPLAAIE